VISVFRLGTTVDWRGLIALAVVIGVSPTISPRNGQSVITLLF